MHFMIDSDDFDAIGDWFWQETFKEIIRGKVRQQITDGLTVAGDLKDIYARQYTDKFPNYEQFLTKIAEMTVIGAENGADEAFDEVYTAFRTRGPLPEGKKHEIYRRPEGFTEEVKREIHDAILGEYSQETSYVNDYKEHYSLTYPTIEEFLNKIADSVVIGAVVGADDMLAGIYQSFASTSPLPRAIRRARRLKGW